MRVTEWEKIIDSTTDFSKGEYSEFLDYLVLPEIDIHACEWEESCEFTGMEYRFRLREGYLWMKPLSLGGMEKFQKISKRSSARYKNFLKFKKSQKTFKDFSEGVDNVEI